MALPSFYNQADQDIYASGDKFIPQERYRLGYTAPPSIANASTGITNTQAASPYIWPPQGGGGGGLHNVYGYDPNRTKTFSKDVWTGEIGGPGNQYGGWETQDVTGYWSPSGWKTAKGKNINHAGLEVPTLMGSIINKLSGIKTGEKQVGDIKGTFTTDEQEEEEAKIAAAVNRRNLLNKIRARAYEEPINVGGGGQDISDIPAGDVNTLGPNNPLIGQIDHTGGGDHGSITREPGSVVEGAPTHSTRDDLMAQGGRIGYRNGEFVDADVNIEGPGYDVNEQTAGFIDPQDALNDMSMNVFGKPLHDLTPDEYQMLIDMANDQAMGEQDQGIASLV